MNCPECRKKLWYWASLSQPHLGLLTYICQRHDTLFVFLEDKRQMPRVLTSWRGYTVFRKELEKRGYQAPPLTQRRGSKEAPSPDSLKPARPSKREGT